MDNGYIWALDLSMSCVGLVIFGNDAKPVLVTSIVTKSANTFQMKLKMIADRLLELKELYCPKTIVLEGAFTRFNKSTQQLYRVHGLVNYLFCEFEQIYYQPMTVKKVVGGKGNMKKKEIQDVILKKYPKIVFSNEDESDAFSVGICYFIENENNIGEGNNEQTN